MAARAAVDAETALFALLGRPGVDHRIIEHAPEGRTGPASELRGHPVEQAAKNIVIRARLGQGRECLAVVVVPGDRRVDLAAVREALGANRAGFADRLSAERATGCVSGTVLPFSFNPDVPLLVDPALLVHEEIFFNAARLDRSVALATADYLALAEPRIAPVAEPGAAALPTTPTIPTAEKVMSR